MMLSLEGEVEVFVQAILDRFKDSEAEKLEIHMNAELQTLDIVLQRNPDATMMGPAGPPGPMGMCACEGCGG